MTYTPWTSEWDSWKKEAPDLPKIDWEIVLPNLPAFDKNFYIPHPDVENRTEEEVAEIIKENKILVIPSTHPCTLPLPKPVTNLIEASFPEYITARLCDLLGGPFAAPTAVQKLLWPVALSGRDCLAVAPTGTGKTLGYLLPAIVHISASEPVRPGDRSPIALVIAPTRELALQITNQAEVYGSAITELGVPALKPMCIVGGESKSDQLWNIASLMPDLIVATPGRLMSMFDKEGMTLHRVTYFVIDEVDRLITEDGKMGLQSNSFKEDLSAISSQIRPDRQCIMCSATSTPDVLETARQLCGNEPVYFQIGEESQSSKLTVSPNVQQTFVAAGDSFGDRLQYLTEIILPGTFTEALSRVEQKIIIFVNSKTRVVELTDALREAGWPAVGTNSDKTQEERRWVYENFTSGVSNILVATDMMGRGMDFQDVRCVVNFELPTTIETYIHRVGRTGRIGKRSLKGYALSFITTREWDILPGLETMFALSGMDVPEIFQKKLREYHEYTNGSRYRQWSA